MMNVQCGERLANRKKEGRKMKTMASVIPALMAASILAAADPIRGASDFSLASLNSDAVFGETTSMKIGSTLSQPDKRTVSSQGNDL
jgi:hypothetical protein